MKPNRKIYTYFLDEVQKAFFKGRDGYYRRFKNLSFDGIKKDSVGYSLVITNLENGQNFRFSIHESDFSIHGDISALFSVFGKFSDVDLIPKKYLDNLSINPFSGKFNFHEAWSECRTTELKKYIKNHVQNVINTLGGTE